MPKWMKTRIEQVEFLRARGYCSALLAHMDERAVAKAYEKEINEVN